MDTIHPEQKSSSERTDFLFTERFTGFMPWLEAARQLQIHDAQAASDLEFFNTQFAMAAPNVTPTDSNMSNVMHYMQKGQDIDTEYWSLVYLLPEDADFIGTHKQVNAVLRGGSAESSTIAGVFNEKYKYIALSGAFEASAWVKGILFLHELRHAHAFFDGQYKDAGVNAHWIEETEVWLYEFELFKAAQPSAWQHVISATKESLKITKDSVSFPLMTCPIKAAVDALDAGPAAIDSFITTVAKAQALYEVVKDNEGEARAKNELAAYLKNV